MKLAKNRHFLVLFLSTVGTLGTLGAGSALALDHSGVISASETWFAADNPHNVIGNITVQAGATLTLEPGVEVYADAGRTINVYGDLQAVGTSGEVIAFQPSGGTNWGGLAFYGPGTGALTHCTVDQASSGLYCAVGAALSVSSTTITGGSYGLNSTSGSVQLADVTFREQISYGIYGNGAAPVLLDGNCLIEDGNIGYYLIGVDGLTLDQALTIRNCDDRGIWLRDCTSPTLDNITLESITGNHGAIFFDDCGEFMLGAGNQIGGAGVENTWPVTMNAGSYPDPLCAIPTTGNTNNDVQVLGGSTSMSVNWPILDGLHYVVNATPTISAGGELTIPDGSTIYFNTSRGLNIYGTLTASAAQADGIRFLPTGTSWAGLSFYGGGAASLQNCLFQDASAAISSNSSGTISLTGCQLVSPSYGINISGGILEMASCTVIDAGTYGLYSNGVTPAFTDGNNVFDNCSTGIYIRNVAGLVFDAPVTLRNNNLGLRIEDCDDPTVDNIVLESNTGAQGAIYFNRSGEFLLGAGNQIGGSGVENTWPVTMNADSYPAPQCVLPTTGNTNNDINVYGGTSSRDVSWPILAGIRYIVTSNPNIGDGTTLTIPDGSTIYFNSGRGINVYGTIDATATVADGIQFVPTGDSWGGLSFYGGGNGTLVNCLLQNPSSGISSSASGPISLTGCRVDGAGYGLNISNGALEMASCTISGSSNFGYYGNGVAPTFTDGGNVFEGGGTGLYIRNVADMVLDMPAVIRNNTTGLRLDGCENSTIDNLVFENNTGTNGALYYTGCGEFMLGAGNQIGGTGVENSWPVTMNADSFPSPLCVLPTSGNTNNDIRVAGGTSTRDAIWPIIPGLHYIVDSNANIGAGHDLVIPDGSTIYFATGRGLAFYGNLVAQASQPEGIRFLPQDSNWSGFSFYGSGGAILENCLLQNTSYALSSSSDGNLSLSGCRLSMGSYGVNISSGSIQLSSNTIEDFLNYGFYGNGVAPQLMDAGNVVRNCGTGIHVRNVAGVILDTPLALRGNNVGLDLEDCEGPLLDNLVLESNTGNHGALFLEDCGEFLLGAGNQIGGPGVENSWPLTINAGSYPHTDSVIPTSGNTDNRIRVYGGSTTRTVIWRDFARIDYMVASTPSIQAGGELIIPAGSDIFFGSSRGLNIYGALTALGTEEEKINFLPEATAWTGLNFRYDGTGQLQYCLVDRAYAGLSLGENADVGIFATSLQNGSYGVNMTGGHLGLINCRIVDNSNYGVYMTGGDMTFGSSLEEWNDIHGNGPASGLREFRTGPNDVHAGWVYWGTMRQTQIWARTYDQLDDPELGYLDFIPHANADHSYVISGVDDDTPGGNVPLVAAVHQNYPNPFNPSTEIRFELPHEAPVKLEIYDISGARVATLLDEVVAAGRHTALWSGLDDGGRQVASGVYFYRFRGGELDETRRMTLVK